MNAHRQAIPKDGRHRYELRVYYEDTDAGGVVYHASYLRFAERGRTEALRALGIPHAEMLGRFSSMFMVRRVEVDYVRPARPDDVLRIETEVQEVSGASVSLRQVVHGSHGLCAALTVRLACVRIATRSGDDRPRDERPRDERPGDARPGDARPGNERPGDERPGDERPGDERQRDDRLGNGHMGDSRMEGHRPARIPPRWRETLAAMRDARRRHETATN